MGVENGKSEMEKATDRELLNLLSGTSEGRKQLLAQVVEVTAIPAATDLLMVISNFRARIPSQGPTTEGAREAS